MKVLFAFGIFLCLSIFVVGHRRAPRPGENSPPQPNDKPVIVIENDYDEKEEVKKVIEKVISKPTTATTKSLDTNGFPCRTQRDCPTFPPSRHMPIYCEHGFCKLGNFRQPKNHFISCKSHYDCISGFCVEGSCNKIQPL
uniref:Secreted protein n=1 Tax=Panagrolaimus sp. PS1159 TaxID=55785 RepID=A0AC35GJ53_9BILA